MNCNKTYKTQLLQAITFIKRYKNQSPNSYYPEHATRHATTYDAVNAVIKLRRHRPTYNCKRSTIWCFQIANGRVL